MIPMHTALMIPIWQNLTKRCGYERDDNEARTWSIWSRDLSDVLWCLCAHLEFGHWPVIRCYRNLVKCCTRCRALFTATSTLCRMIMMTCMGQFEPVLTEGFDNGMMARSRMGGNSPRPATDDSKRAHGLRQLRIRTYATPR